MTMIAIRYEKVKEINGYFYWTYRMRKYGYKIKPIKPIQMEVQDYVS